MKKRRYSTGRCRAAGASSSTRPVTIWQIGDVRPVRAAPRSSTPVMDANPMTQDLRDFAAAQLDTYGAPDDRDAARHLVGTGQIPDDLLAAMPEVSRHNAPQVSPQEYECGCVTITRVTDRNGSSWRGRLEAPFEMRLALPCDGAHCELTHLRKERAQ
jgi:hypothetical protein